MKFNSKTMTIHNADSVPYLTYNSLSEIDFINHAFSTKLGGVSTGEFTSMNFAFNRGDNPDSVTENYKRFCKSAGFDYNTLTASAQDHNTYVRAVTTENIGTGIYKPRDIESVDALITNQKGVTLVTYYADCTPLFFVDTNKKAIGLAPSIAELHYEIGEIYYKTGRNEEAAMSFQKAVELGKGRPVVAMAKKRLEQM